MGAELITVSWTSHGTDHTQSAIFTAIDALNDDAIDALLETSQSLGPLSGDKVDEDGPAEVLKEGAIEYLSILADDHRYATWEPVGDDVRHYTAGGQTWGDDPFDGWSALFCFLEACEADESLAAAAGFVGFGVSVTGPSPEAMMQAFAEAMDREGLNADMVSRILDDIAAQMHLIG